MRVVVSEDVQRDLTKGYKFYEKREAGKGAYFLRRLREDLQALEKEAGLHSQLLGYYKANSTRFPHLLCYRIIAGEAVVHAIVDGRRRPAGIRALLRRRTPPSGGARPLKHRLPPRAVVNIAG